MASEKHYQITVLDSEQSRRIDRLLAARLPDYSRSFLQKLIRDQHVTVDGNPVASSYKVNRNDVIDVRVPPPVETTLVAEDIPLDIVFEDEHLLVVNKKAGMVVHPGAGIHTGTLVNALMHHCRDLSGVGGRLRPGIVHRLDKNTSGLLVIAKNDVAHVHLQQQFASKTAARTYQAIVWGRPEPVADTITNFLNRSKSDRKKFSVAQDGKEAITLYETMETFSFLSLLKIRLKTGRTHQIRVHMLHRQHPVFGDPEYSGRKKQINRLSALSERNFAVYLLKGIDRQALHAITLGFQHPASGEMLSFSSELPKDMNSLLYNLKQHEDKS